MSQNSTHNSSSSSSSADPRAQTAFRSFWTAPPSHGSTPDVYEFDPNYRAHANSSSAATHTRTDRQNVPSSSSSSSAPRNTHNYANGSSASSAAVLDAIRQQQQQASGYSSEATPLLSSTAAANDVPLPQEEIQLIEEEEASLQDRCCATCTGILPMLLFCLALYIAFTEYSGTSYLPLLFGHQEASSPSQTIIIDNQVHRLAAQCDPFAFVAHSVDLAHHHGIVANLSVIKDDQIEMRKQSQTTLDYEANATPVNATFFFSSLDTPTRLFTDRFVASTSSGNLQTDSQSNSSQKITLPSEYFFMSMRTRLQPDSSSSSSSLFSFLSMGQATNSSSSSLYQFALISDDGAVVINEKDASILIDNDYIHCTRLALSTRPYSFQDDEYLSLNIKYFQGPPAHIALQMLYRPWPPAKDNEAEVAIENEMQQENKDAPANNDLFWIVSDNQTASIPTSNYQLLIEEQGWKVIPASWFYLPEQYETKSQVDALLAAGLDPCNQ